MAHAGAVSSFSRDIRPIEGANAVPSTVTDIVRAPFRIYYAYNPLRLLEEVRGETSSPATCSRGRAATACTTRQLCGCSINFANRARPSASPSAPPSSVVWIAATVILRVSGRQASAISIESAEVKARL